MHAEITAELTTAPVLLYVDRRLVLIHRCELAGCRLCRSTASPRRVADMVVASCRGSDHEVDHGEVLAAVTLALFAPIAAELEPALAAVGAGTVPGLRRPPVLAASVPAVTPPRAPARQPAPAWAPARRTRRPRLTGLAVLVCLAVAVAGWWPASGTWRRSEPARRIQPSPAATTSAPAPATTRPAAPPPVVVIPTRPAVPSSSWPVGPPAYSPHGSQSAGTPIATPLPSPAAATTRPSSTRRPAVISVCLLHVVCTGGRR